MKNCLRNSRQLTLTAIWLCVILSMAGWPNILNEFKITANDAATGDNFGESVAIDGDFAVAGAPFDDDAGSSSGSAYIFKFDGTNWNQQAKLVAADAAAGDNFGRFVAIDGDRVVVGAPFDDDAGTNSGSAYVFRFDGTNWSQEAKLTASDAATEDRLGEAVSINGDRVAVGARRDDDTGIDAGSAYVFRFDGTAWNQEAKLTASDAAAGDQFGRSVSISGTATVVGAHLDDDDGVSSGSAYVFRFDGTAWNQEAKLTASDAAAGDEFGLALSIDTDCILVGAHFDDDAGLQSGSAYVFRFDGTIWNEEAKLAASDAAAGDEFGFSVSISNHRAAVGANLDDDGGSASGSAYVIFKNGGTSWSEESKLTASDPARFDQFGKSVSIRGDRAIAGAPFDDDFGGGSGSAYIFFLESQNQPPVADAGPDQTVDCTSPSGAVVTLDGSGSSDPDGDPLTFTWREDNVIIAGPTTDPSADVTLSFGDHTIELTVNDPANETAQGEVIVTVECPLPHDFVLLADKEIKIDGQLSSDGDMHSNDEIEFEEGLPSIHTGNLFAVGDIEIEEDNTIDGDVTAGEEIELEEDAIITGTVTSNAVVAVVPLPTLSFSDGTENVTVGKNGTMSLAPGSYHDVKIEENGTLFLNNDGSTGDYFMHKLDVKKFGILSIDVSQGPVNINLVDKFHFDKDVQVVITPAGQLATRFVTFNIADNSDLHIHERSAVSGNIIAPTGKVKLYEDAFFKGAVCAKEIEVKENVILLHHTSSGTINVAVSPDDDDDDDELDKRVDEALDSRGIPDTFELFQNYPNPFNPETNIQFQLPEASHVKLRIFNILGKEIRRLVDSQYALGRHHVQWDGLDNTGSQVSSGIYFYRIEANNFRQIKAMSLVR